jgi:hypothetical protein
MLDMSDEQSKRFKKLLSLAVVNFSSSYKRLKEERNILLKALRKENDYEK